MSDDENVSRLANPNQLQHQRSKPHDNGAMKQLAAHLRRKKKRGRPKGPKGPEGRKPVNEDTKEERPAPPEKKRQKRPPFKYGMARKKQTLPLSTKQLQEKLREASFVEDMRQLEEFSLLMRLKVEMAKRPAAQ